MNSFTRRSFLKISGATFAGAAAVSTVKYAVAGAGGNHNTSDKVRKVPTYCNLCFWKCGAIAYVKNGKVWKVEGNPKDPLSNGRLCPRGSGGPGAVNDPDRLQAPLIRTSVRGKDQWKVVTWDEAFNYIADKMNKIKAEYGPESVAGLIHGIGGSFLKHFLRAYGTKHLIAPSFAQCRGPREVGFELTNGNFIGSPERTDIENSKCMALIGSHLGENMHNTQVQEFSKAIDKGISLIVVDPRFSIAAGKAKYYLPIKPGTDMALLLAWANVMIKENLYDKEFIEKHAFGFEQFAAEVAQYTPEWAYIETGIEPSLIYETARELAKNKPASFIHPGRHATWYGDDTQRIRLIALVNSLLGNWNHKGAFFEPVKMSIPKYDYPAYPEVERERADNPHEKYPWGGEAEGLTTGIREATISGKPYPIKGWWVYATNLMQSLPNREETIKAINNLDLMVVIDVLPNEITGYADVVLPESVYLERHDELNAPSFKVPFVALRQPAVEPPHDQKPSWWMMKKLADKMNLGHYFPWKNAEEYLKARIDKAGLSFEQLKKDGVILGEEKPIYVEDGVEQYFYTPSGKVEFYSMQLEEKGFDPIPKYKKPKDAPAGYYRLLFGRSPVHTFSSTENNRLLLDMEDTNEVWLNADVASRWAIKSGQFVKLKNQDGVISNKVKVKVTQKIRTDCVYMTHGWGQTNKMARGSYLKGASDSQMVTKYEIDPLMGGTGMNVNFVTFITEGV